MDISEMKQEAFNFRSRLNSIKANLAPTDFSWYPYDTLGNFVHLDKLLTGQRRSLTELIAAGPVLDIGAADGDLAFFVESLGLAVDVVENPATNNNGLRGLKLLRDQLGSKIELYEIDIDAGDELPNKRYSLAFFLGTLYHIKNSFQILEAIARRASYCLMSTRIARFVPDHVTEIANLPIAYLLDDYEANCDPTNFWVFSEAGLKRLLMRSGWDTCDFITVGDTASSDPGSADRDERAFCLIKSRHF